MTIQKPSKKSIDAADMYKSGGAESIQKEFAKQIGQIPPIRPTTKMGSHYGTSNLEDLRNYIASTTENVDFNLYIDGMGGNHKNYIKTGKTKIPYSILAVVVNDYMVKQIYKLGYAIGQLYSNEANVKIAYLYNGKYWLQVTESFIKELLRDILVKMGYDPIESKTFIISDQLAKTFWNNTPKLPISSPNRVLINLRNITLEILPNGEIVQHKHTKDDFMQYCLDYEYSLSATCPIFIKYLDRVLPDKESQIVLQELIGSIFIKNLNLEKIGILLGSGSNGKSVLLKIITALLGKNNISQMDLKSLTTDRNADNNRASLIGKLLNFAPEINAKGEQSHDLIKRMASSEAIQVKLLYKDTITITDYAKLIFNANSLPSDVEHSHGFFRRFLIIVFDQTITEDEKDPQLATKIIEDELPAILNWIIEGAKRLQKNKKFSPCRKSDEILARYKLESDVVAMWLEENNYVADSSTSQDLQTLYNSLVNFIDLGGYKKITIKTLADRLRSSGFRQRKGKPAAFYMMIKVYHYEK